jgi:hypothetical protein
LVKTTPLSVVTFAPVAVLLTLKNVANAQLPFTLAAREATAKSFVKVLGDCWKELTPEDGMPVTPLPLPEKEFAVMIPENVALAGRAELGIVPVRFVAATELALEAVVAVAALPEILIAAVPAVKLAGFKFVTAPPSPESARAVMVPAAKLPEASRKTIAPGTLVLVAALAALTPAATLAADCPPTLATAVAA